ncbi:MAG: hypothetical protein R2706_05595 [Acidimicrobiales bacterium]
MAQHVDLLSRDRERLVTVVGLAAANWLLGCRRPWVALGVWTLPGVVGVLVAYGLATSSPRSPFRRVGLVSSRRF